MIKDQLVYEFENSNEFVAELSDSGVFNRELKLRVSGNGKRQVRTFLAKFSLNVFVSYFHVCVERIVMHCRFKIASLFTLYCLIPYNFSLPGVCRLPYNEHRCILSAHARESFRAIANGGL